MEPNSVKIFLLVSTVGYLLGSFPTAYLILRRKYKMDIREEGSKNVGGRNAYEVTGNRSVGLAVVVIDALKGLLAADLTMLCVSRDSGVITAAIAAVIVGHCYPLWLKFHGGRGLATAAGALAVVAWVSVPVWLALYFLGEKIVKNVHIATVLALLLLPIIASALPHEILVRYVRDEFTSKQFITAIWIIVGIILTRHIEPIYDLVNGTSIQE